MGSHGLLPVTSMKEHGAISREPNPPWLPCGVPVWG